MREFKSNAEFTVALQSLVEQWCDTRNFAALARLLPVFIGFNGLTDGWHELTAGLKSTRALGHEAFSAAEWDILNDLIHAADQALRGR
jgi:hypothetical protein